MSKRPRFRIKSRVERTNRAQPDLLSASRVAAGLPLGENNISNDVLNAMFFWCAACPVDAQKTGTRMDDAVLGDRGLCPS